MNNIPYRLYPVEFPNSQLGYIVVPPENDRSLAKRENENTPLVKKATNSFVAQFAGGVGAVLGSQLTTDVINNFESIRAFLGA